jgi:hypothetical protein
MLKVTIELISAITGATSEIGRMYIANDGTASRANPKLGDYMVAVCRRGAFEYPKKNGPRPAREGRVVGYPRLAHNVWRLITRALHVTFPEESAPAKRKAGDAPVLNASVMRGLNALAEQARKDVAEGWDKTDDETAALEWLDAENRKD